MWVCDFLDVFFADSMFTFASRPGRSTFSFVVKGNNNAMLWCAVVLCCALLCCVRQCCALFCFAALCCALLCCAVLW